MYGTLSNRQLKERWAPVPSTRKEGQQSVAMKVNQLAVACWLIRITYITAGPKEELPIYHQCLYSAG